MNRQFSVALTPAKARLMVMMSAAAELRIDDAIIELAEQDRVPEETWDKYAVEDPMERQAIQFITDLDFRAGLPVKLGEENRAKTLIHTALAIAGITETVELDSLEKHDFLSIIPHRKKVILVNTGTRKDFPSMVSKCFPRILCYGSMVVQYSLLGNGAKCATTDSMGQIINPMVEKLFVDSTYKRTEPRSLIAMGVYPYLVEEGKIWDRPRRLVQE